MLFSEKQEDYGLITVYGDTPQGGMARAISRAISDRDLKIMTPQTRENLEKACENSVLILVGITSDDDPNFALGRQLQESRMIAADIIAFAVGSYNPSYISILGRAFDGLLRLEDVSQLDLKKFLLQKIARGNRRLSGLILEEEYRRICDALSSAPASMIVFDADKRAVFVSDHYYRAYPKIAPRLIRGLSVYDCFDMMMKEEGIPDDDPRHERLQKFWYNLEGRIEFTLDDGTSYRLKAVRLPNHRGTVVMAQNVSEFLQRRSQYERESESLGGEISALADEGIALTNRTERLLPPSGRESPQLLEALEGLNTLFRRLRSLI